MQAVQPGRSALGAARHRAVHQVLERGSIFADTLAVRILGPDTEAAIGDEDSCSQSVFRESGPDSDEEA